MAVDVSIVIPVHNGAGTIPRAVKSVLGQTKDAFELIIVNDGSTDDLDAQLAEFTDPRIRIIRNDQCRGAANARNRGIADATGEFVAFLDADDEWLPDKLSTQLAVMRAEPDARQASCTGYFVRRSPGDPGEPWKPSRRIYRYGDLVSGCFLSPGSTLMVRRAHFETVGLYNEDLSRLEDWDWLLRSAAISPITAIPQPLTHVYRTRRPSHDAVANAVEKISDLHGAGARRAGFRTGVRFRATLRLELSAAAFNHGRYKSSAILLGQSLICHPFRPASFYWGMIRVLVGR